MVEFLLRAAYESAYASAICNRCEKLFLTLIGGGNLNNDPALIHRVIGETHMKMMEKYNTSLREVYLPYFDFNSSTRLLLNNLKGTFGANNTKYEVYTCDSGVPVIEK